MIFNKGNKAKKGANKEGGPSDEESENKGEEDGEGAGKGPKLEDFNSRPNWFFLILFAFFLGLFFFSGQDSLKEITWQEFKREMLEPKDVKKVEVINKERAEVYLKESALDKEQYKADEVTKTPFGYKNPGPHYYFTIGSVETFQQKLDEAQKDFSREETVAVSYSSRRNWMRDILSWLIPIALFVGLWLFIMSRVQKGMGAGGGAGSSLMNFTRSKAQVYEKDGKRPNVSFDDVAGLDEAKVEVQEVVDFLTNPENYTRVGARIPKGVLLVGPPGTGKTLMGKAVAGEAEVPFFSLSGSDFVEMFVGVGASRVRDVFKKAREKAPCIVFIDEIDAIGRSRGSSRNMMSNDERESTLNQLLKEMDGFDTNQGVIVLGATNRADVLDSAMLRPGRFDRHIYIELPTLKEREAIFKVHLAPLNIKSGVDTHLLASQTAGFSGADIANVCNEAALIAARNKKEAVDQDDMVDAMDRIIAGMEKKSKQISEEEKEVIAYHEAGHAIISWLLKNVDPLVKVSIIPRGKSLGSNWYLPSEHQIRKESEFFDQICAALGGRGAEEVVFGEVSSGALNDLEKVTKQAYTMVAMYGLSDKLKNISYHDSTGQQNNAFHKPYSEATGKIIDEEVRNILNESYDRSLKILRENKDSLDELAKLLIEKEVIFSQDIEKVLGKRSEVEV